MSGFFKRTRSILGMNERSLTYLLPYNLKTSRHNADNKLKTKKLLESAGLPVPGTYAVIKNRQQLMSFDFDSLPKSFVIKPNLGFGGEGIMVVFGRKKNDVWVGPLNGTVTKSMILLQCNDILEGFYSLNHAPDSVFFEERIKLHPDLKLYSYKGIPDIRLIIFNKIPVMAMLRLPTKNSGGKANLMQGGVGVGIDISQGVTTHSVMKGRFFGVNFLEHIPGTRIPLRGIQIPFWDDILSIGVRAGEAVGLGYSGIDIALDKEKGPVVLEVNARPGLEIQNANMATLGDRLRRVNGLNVKTVKKGISIAKELFGGEIRQELEEISGKSILGREESVKIMKKNGESELVRARIDTGAFRSSIDMEFARKLGYGDIIDYAKEHGAFEVDDKEKIKELHKEKYDILMRHPEIVSVTGTHNSNGSTLRIVVELELFLGNRRIVSKIGIMDRSDMRYPLLIGRKDLVHFLVDSTKRIR